MIKLTPSSAHIWYECTASPSAVVLDAEAGVLPASEQSIYAAEGDTAHLVLSNTLNLYSVVGEASARQAIGEIHRFGDFEVEVTPEMADAVDQAIDRIADFGDPADVHSELELDVAWLTGSYKKARADVVLYLPNEGQLHVFDYKHGAGIFVNPKFNHQNRIYAASFIQSLKPDEREKIKTVHLHILQPRMGNFSYEVLSRVELVQYTASLRERVVSILTGDVKFATGPHCRSCSRRSRCVHLKESVFDWLGGIGDDFELEDLISPHTLTDEVLADLYPKLDFISSWAKNISEYMKSEMIKGRNFPGLKMVEGRKPARKWANEKKAAAYLKKILGDRAFETKLVSPSKAEGLIGKKNLTKEVKELWVQGEPGLILVPVDDPRPDHKEAILNMFD